MSCWPDSLTQENDRAQEVSCCFRNPFSRRRTVCTRSSGPSLGHGNAMCTGLSMNALAEALGMTLPGSAAIPAPYRERGQMAYECGLRIVSMVKEDLTPEKVMTRVAFENAIVAVSYQHLRAHET